MVSEVVTDYGAGNPDIALGRGQLDLLRKRPGRQDGGSVSFSMRRKVQPSRPSAITCFCFFRKGFQAVSPRLI